MTNMLYALSASLAQAIGQDELLCRGVLRMSIINSVQRLREINDPVRATTEAANYITKMTYQDWKAIIEGPALSRNLTVIGIKDAPAATARLLQALVEQQSLFTMTAR